MLAETLVYSGREIGMKKMNRIGGGIFLGSQFIKGSRFF